MKNFKVLSLGLLIFVLFVGFVVFYYKAAVNRKHPGGSEGGAVDFVITPGEEVAAIAERLEKADLLNSANLFKIYVRSSNLYSSLQAGRYKIPKNLSLKELVELLKHGTFDVKLTFIEGWRREEMAEYLKSKIKSQRSKVDEDFLQLTEGLEGYLFPDTYFVSQEAEAKDLVKMMRENFNRKFTEEMKLDTARTGLTLEEVVNLASIVEREAKFNKDRPLVAGILIKRYKNSWPLEADATVQYALANNETDWWPKKITNEDLEIDSPYNTRKYVGLPPTPICSPGLEALKAVIYPQDSPYWYYVSDKEGRMHYAQNLEEHLENVATYLTP